jgi:hypothetical protein
VKITVGQLRRIIREQASNWDLRRARWDRYKRLMRREPGDYFRWVEDQGHITPAASSVLATYIATHRDDRGEEDLIKEPKVIRRIALHLGLDYDDVVHDLLRQKREGVGESI